MSVNHADSIALQKSFSALPSVTYAVGETVLAAGSRTGKVLVLEKGAVSVIMDGIEIARVTEPGAVFGEISALLTQPHSADVRAVETSRFRVTNATTLHDPAALQHVAAMLACRLVNANQTIAKLKKPPAKQNGYQR